MPYTSRIANKILVTPFDDKSTVPEEVTKKLTDEEFCKHCYCRPKFEESPQQYLYEELKNEDSDSLISYEEIKDQIHQQAVAYENFELWLNNFENDKVYTINGNAGTGKTTFINYKRYKDTKIKWIILDIHRARSFDEWMSDIRTDISHFEQAEAKVYGSIMNKIWELIFQGTDENDCYSLQIVYDNLKRITVNYKNKYACLYPSGRTLLDEVCKEMEKDKDILEKVEASARLFRTYINGQIGKDSGAIKDILSIFLLLLRCIFDDIEERYLIVFDNFERFIEKDELYNKDVDNIRLLLTSYVKYINQKGRLHKGHFKFAMAVRDSTARMCGVRLHASDAEASNLNVEDWYDTEEIIKLKKDWYSEKEIPIENLDVIEKIIGDFRICTDQTIKGLKLLIDPLFNNNKRLIIDFIGTMVESPGNKENIEIYLKLWKEDTSSSRFAARSIIRGMILNELENKPDKLFEHLKTYSTFNRKSGLGDSRKILTILYNNMYKNKINEVPLLTILSELFQRTDVMAAWTENEYLDKRSTISQVLFYMNSYNRRENDWIQFVDLQFHRNDRDIIVKDPSELEEIIAKNMKKCMVHLMPAGKAYLLYIVASFEFFSLRYVSDYTPLFTLVPTAEEIVKCSNVKQLPCYKKITNVAKHAKNCSDLLRKNEDTIKIHIGNSANGKYHRLRIIEQHKSYLDSFVEYIKNKYCSSNTISTYARSKFEALCREITLKRNEYNKF